MERIFEGLKRKKENGGNMNREESIVFAQKFLEDILSFFGVNLAVYSTSEDQVIQLSVPSSELNSLFIGRDSGNLRALQFLVSRALESKNAEITRVSIDVADYKKQRAQKISQKAEKWIEQVRKTGEPYRLNLNPTDRFTVHKLAQDYSDIETHSEGEGRERQLVISKK